MTEANKRSRPRGMELFEIKPTIVGGDPTSLDNKTWLTRRQHFEAVRYRYGVIHSLRNERK